MCDLLAELMVFFFRASHRNKDVGSSPFVCSAINNRFGEYLVDAKFFEGEPPCRVTSWIREDREVAMSMQ